VIGESPLVVKFSNGKTRTVPLNEALWIPDAMFERIRFEINLPTTSRRYLEELNDNYPCDSLPGYPTNQGHKIDCVVMPRMIYDIWPYFTPFYPQYMQQQDLSITTPMAPVVTTQSYTINSPLVMNSNPFNNRQIQKMSAAVEAATMNSSHVIGTNLTTLQLDEKIKQQIFSNQHLLDLSDCNCNKSFNCNSCCCRKQKTKE
jgi:hypothetical protein